jgi:hypothetical protein
MNFFLCEPYLLSLKPDSEMNIIWVQSTIADAFVEYGSDDSLGKKVKAECYELKGLRLPNDDGTFDVYVNINLPDELQRRAIDHELRHIRKDHFYNDDPVWLNEQEAG